MIKFNKKIKYISYLFAGSCISLFTINLYKQKYSHFEVDLSSIELKLKNSSVNNNKNERSKLLCDGDDPFELVRNFDVDEYLLKEITTVLYTPPLTNKLFPKSNLYGHELIRYFDR